MQRPVGTSSAQAWEAWLPPGRLGPLGQEGPSGSLEVVGAPPLPSPPLPRPDTPLAAGRLRAEPEGRPGQAFRQCDLVQGCGHSCHPTPSGFPKIPSSILSLSSALTVLFGSHFIARLTGLEGAAVVRAQLGYRAALLTPDPGGLLGVPTVFSHLVGVSQGGTRLPPCSGPVSSSLTEDGCACRGSL